MSEQGSMTGKIFGGRYQINDRIGVGGMAEVYRAQDTVLGRSVAVKVMLPQYASDPGFTRRFRQEAAAAANLQSPYIVNVYDWGQDGDTYYIVMEYVRGTDLKTAIKQRGAINQRKVAEIGSQVCQALTVAHNQDIIHRDIKPQNIMVQPDGNVKVMDFGIARAKNSVDDKTGSVLGTAHYISPEQAQGKELTPASDIYSLGVVLYEAATGKLPFDGPDAMSVALMQVKDYPTPPSEIKPDIDPAFEDIIMTALEKDPNDRFATANDMRLALNDFLAGRTAKIDDGFTSEQTRVITPAAGAAAAGATQVMPGVADAKTAQTTTGTIEQNGSTDTSAKKKRRRRGIIAAIIAVIAVIAIAGIAYALISGANTTEKISVPDVVGKSQEEATQIIEDAGLEVGAVSSKYDNDVEQGNVISQSPKAEEEADKGSKVNLVISQGAESFEVPNIVGKTVEEAQKLADENGLILKQSSTDNSDTVEADHIISQDPGVGSAVKEGDTLYYVLSLGKATTLVSVPSVVGYSESSARSILSNAGLNVAVDYEYSSYMDKGDVVSQSPTAGSSVESGTTITIVVSQGPETTMVTVPDVTGQTLSSAQSALLNRGLDVDVEYENSDTVSEGRVIWQSIGSGNRVEEGTTVTITISNGPEISGYDNSNYNNYNNNNSSNNNRGSDESDNEVGNNRYNYDNNEDVDDEEDEDEEEESYNEYYEDEDN